MTQSENMGRLIDSGLMILWLAIGIGLLAMAYWAFGEEIQLETSGVNATAQVVSVDTRQCGGRRTRRTCFSHDLSADGRNFSITLDQQIPVGSMVKVHYLPSEENQIVLGPKATNVWAHLQSKMIQYVAVLLGSLVGFWLAYKFYVKVRTHDYGQA